jgi:hypothetical protein
MATEIVILDDQPSAAAAALAVLWGEGVNPPVGFRVSPWTRVRSNWIRSRLTAGRPLKRRPIWGDGEPRQDRVS